MTSAENRSHRWRRLRTSPAPVTAMAALALASSLALAPNARAVPATAPVSATAAPRYYMALPGADNFANVPGAPTAVLVSTFTGKNLLTVRPSGKDEFVSVSAAADDRTFVLGAAPNLRPPAVPAATIWYLVQVTPGPGFTATVRKLRVPAPPQGSRADTTALSPDGRELALLGTQPVSKTGYTEFLRVYSVATGRLLRSWSGPLNVAWDAYTTLSWTAGGRRLAIGYTWYARSAQYLGVRMLDVTRPGHDLIADSRLAWSTRTFLDIPKTYPLTCAIDIRAVVTADGRTVVCSAAGVFRAVSIPNNSPACPAIRPWESVGFLEYSTATGKLVRPLYRDSTNCILEGIDVLWAGTSGRTIVGFFRFGALLSSKPFVMRFGMFSSGRFTPLPVPPTTTTAPNAIAW